MGDIRDRESARLTNWILKRYCAGQGIYQRAEKAIQAKRIISSLHINHAFSGIHVLLRRISIPDIELPGITFSIRSMT